MNHRHGVQQDNISFTCLLYACNHAKVLQKDLEIFDTMIVEYDLSPTIDRHTCIVDLYAKPGCLVKIEDFLDHLSGPSLWSALLTLSKMHGEINLGNGCFHQHVCATPYILMAKAYPSDDLLDDGS